MERPSGTPAEHPRVPTRLLGGVAVPVLGQGTWQMQGRHERRSITALRRGLELGLSHIDTAEMYGSGQVEQLVGRCIAGRRDEVYLVSKVLPGNASRAGTKASCEASLQRLGTDRLDLYLLHWPGPHPLEQTFEAFEQLVQQGKILAWGVSNFDVDELQRALAVAGPGRLVCNQVCYHLGARYVERRLIPWCAAHDVAVVGYSPFGSGQFPGGTGAAARVLARIAAAHEATPRQVALRYLTRQRGLFTIPKAGHPEHVEENARALKVALSAEDVRLIEEAYPLRTGGGLPVI